MAHRALLGIFPLLFCFLLQKLETGIFATPGNGEMTEGKLPKTPKELQNAIYDDFKRKARLIHHTYIPLCALQIQRKTEEPLFAC